MFPKRIIPSLAQSHAKLKISQIEHSDSDISRHLGARGGATAYHMNNAHRRAQLHKRQREHSDPKKKQNSPRFDRPGKRISIPHSATNSFAFKLNVGNGAHSDSHKSRRYGKARPETPPRTTNKCAITTGFTRKSDREARDG